MSIFRRVRNRWCRKVRPRWPGRPSWPISGSATAAELTAPINHPSCRTGGRAPQWRKGPGLAICGPAMQPFDPRYPEMRRRRFRPIPIRMLVPNFITLLAICAGLTAIRLSTEGRMELAVAAIVFAAVLDGVDGVRDQRRPAAGAFQRGHGRSEQARLRGEFLQRRSGACRRDHRTAPD